VGKLRTVLPLSDVIRDSAVQLGLTRQRGAIGVAIGAGGGAGAVRRQHAAGEQRGAGHARGCGPLLPF
jgi:hypothetical protein